MKHIFALLFGIFAAVTAKAQNPGYFNHKNVLEFSFNGQVPLFANIREITGDDYFNKLENSTFVRQRDFFDYGFRFAYMRTLKRDLGIGLEFGYDYFTVQRETQYNSGWFYGNTYFQKTDVSSMMIMPKIEFSNKGSVLPMGISHQIGLGVRLVKPTDEQSYYIHMTDGSLPYGKKPLIKNPYDYKGGAVRGMTLMYAVNMRTPLSKRLFLNYGLRYTLNFMSKPSYLDIEEYQNNETPELMEAEFRSMVRQRKQLSFIQASLGISFAF